MKGLFRNFALRNFSPSGEDEQRKNPFILANHSYFSMAANKVLFISQEVSPYLPDTPMSLLGRAIPQAIHGKEFEVRIFTPKYGSINERRNQLHEVIRLSGMNLIIDDNDHPLIIKVATLLPSRMQVYFIDNDDYFHSLPEKGLETELLPGDNDERIMFFTTGVIETAKKLRWAPAIIHCSGWVSALAPLYIRRLYSEDPTFRDSKIVFALQPEAFEGTLDPRFTEKLRMNDLSSEDLNGLNEKEVDFLALNKIAIDYADAVIQMSEDVNPEILEYARSSGKPFLGVIEEADRKQTYTDFYHSLIGDSED